MALCPSWNHSGLPFVSGTILEMQLGTIPIFWHCVVGTIPTCLVDARTILDKGLSQFHMILLAPSLLWLNLTFPFTWTIHMAICHLFEQFRTAVFFRDYSWNITGDYPRSLHSVVGTIPTFGKGLSLLQMRLNWSSLLQMGAKVDQINYNTIWSYVWQGPCD